MVEEEVVKEASLMFQLGSDKGSMEKASGVARGNGNADVKSITADHSTEVEKLDWAVVVAAAAVLAGPIRVARVRGATAPVATAGGVRETSANQLCCGRAAQLHEGRARASGVAAPRSAGPLGAYGAALRQKDVGRLF